MPRIPGIKQHDLAFAVHLRGIRQPVLNTTRFRKGVPVTSDRHLARYLNYVSEFPRGAPPLE